MFWGVLLVILASEILRADETASLILTGTVPQAYSLDVEALPKATQLNIAGGESRQLVAIVRERSNVSTGYIVRVSSANNGVLAHESGLSEHIPYQITYDGKSSLRPSANPTSVKSTNVLSNPVDHRSPVEITFVGRRSAMAGVYSDTLTFEITAP